jgi:hypothetical protein
MDGLPILRITSGSPMSAATARPMYSGDSLSFSHGIFFQPVSPLSCDITHSVPMNPGAKGDRRDIVLAQFLRQPPKANARSNAWQQHRSCQYIYGKPHCMFNFSAGRARLSLRTRSSRMGGESPAGCSCRRRENIATMDASCAREPEQTTNAPSELRKSRGLRVRSSEVTAR